MDGYKDGDRRRSDALEVTRPLVRGSCGPLRKTPPVTCHAALIGNCQCETGNTFTLATFKTPCAPPIKIKISHKSLYNATKFHTLLEVSPQKFQAGLYLTKTYHIEPFTSISRNRPSALRQTLQSRSNPPCNVWTGAYGHAPSTIKNGEGRQADLPRFTLPGFPAY